MGDQQSQLADYPDYQVFIILTALFSAAFLLDLLKY